LLSSEQKEGNSVLPYMLYDKWPNVKLSHRHADFANYNLQRALKSLKRKAKKLGFELVPNTA